MTDNRQIDHQQTQFNINIHASPPIKQHMENTFSQITREIFCSNVP